MALENQESIVKNCGQHYFYDLEAVLCSMDVCGKYQLTLICDFVVILNLSLNDIPTLVDAFFCLVFHVSRFNKSVRSCNHGNGAFVWKIERKWKMLLTS